jgi:cytochrome c biogenesis protein
VTTASAPVPAPVPGATSAPGPVDPTGPLGPRGPVEPVDPVGQGALDPEGVDLAAAPASTMARFYAAAWHVFISLKVTVVTLVFVILGCLAGMFFDQTLTYEEHAAQWASAAWKLRLYTFLELNDVFGSWWFGLIICVLLINLVACSIERLPKIIIDLQNPRKRLGDDQLRGIKHVYRTIIGAEARERTLRIVEAMFGGKAEALEGEDGATYRFFERHRYARTGVYIVHTGLVIIMVTGIINGWTKLDGIMMVREGTTGRFVRLKGPGNLPYSHDLGFEVRCDDFRLKTFIDGAPMEFESDLSVWDPASPVNPVLRKTIQVNDPLEYKGYTFYQASYNPIPGDQMVQLDVGPRGSQRRTHTLSIGEKLQMADGTAFTPVEVISEFAGLGAAVRVQETAPDGASTSYVVFREYPDFDRLVRRGSYDVQFRGFDQSYATGLQVGRVPWVPAIFIGFAVMFAGMFMAFFMSQRRYWARLAPRPDLGPDKLELIVAGAARRHQYAFAEEFEKMREVLVTAFGAGQTTADRARALRERRRAERAAAGGTTETDKS